MTRRQLLVRSCVRAGIYLGLGLALVFVCGWGGPV
jgi:hypothetical protein